MRYTDSVSALAAASFMALLAAYQPALADELDDAKATCQQRVAEQAGITGVTVEFARLIDNRVIEVRGRATEQSGAAKEFFCQVDTIGDMKGQILNIGYN